MFIFKDKMSHWLSWCLLSFCTKCKKQKLCIIFYKEKKNLVFSKRS